MKTEKTARFCLTGILSIAIILTVSGGGVLAKQEGQSQKLCPVMGGEIDKSAYVDYEGKRVYFCCAGAREPSWRTLTSTSETWSPKGLSLERVPEAKTGDSGK